MPYAADYTRFSRSRRGALAGTGLGYFVPDVWLLALGAVLVLSRGLGDPAALPAAVVAGGFAAIVALFALLVTETDEAFANAYSAAVSLQNAVPRAPQKLLIVVVTAIATAGALVVDFVSYQSFLLLLGSVFVPLFAVLLADWLAAGAHYTADDIFGSPPWRPGLIAAWIAGFALYQWLFPTGPAWWVDLVGRLNPPDWGIGATVPSFLVSFAIASVVALVARRGNAGSCARMTSIAALGHLTRDVVDGAPTATGRRGLLRGQGARAPRRRRARRGGVQRRRIAPSSCRRSRPSGFRRRWHESSTTTEYSFHYEGDRRIMRQDAVGDPWTPAQAVAAAGDAIWVDVCALTRTDFPAETLAALAADGRRLLVDLQGLVRTATIGPLHTDEHIGDVLRHVEVLKLNDEEAETLVGSAEPETLLDLGVPEVILTLGSQGAWVITPDARRARARGSGRGRGRSHGRRRHLLRHVHRATRRRSRAGRGRARRRRDGLRVPRVALEAELAARDDDRAAAAEARARSRRPHRRRAQRASKGDRSLRPARSRSTRPTRRARADRGGRRAVLPPSRSRDPRLPRPTARTCASSTRRAEPAKQLTP